MKGILLGVFISFLVLPLSYSQTIDAEQSVVEFSVKNLIFNKVKGTIKGMEGTVVFNPQDLAKAKFNTSIDVATLDTGNKKRDNHLRSEDFFEVNKYAKIRFESQKIEKTADGYNTTGTLTIKDVSKMVEIPFTVIESGNKMTFTGNLTINRKDYNVGTDISNFTAKEEVNLSIVCVARRK